MTWVVCPLYKDVESFLILRRYAIRETELISSFSSHSYALRFVVIDDSAGLDFEITKIQDLNDVLVIRVPFNLGHQRAIVFALRRMKSLVKPDHYIVTMDSDGEDKPEDIRRLIEALILNSKTPGTVALAQRTRRSESLKFKVSYFFFKIFFHFLTGQIIRSGNFACFYGSFLENSIWHPNFDLCYSSTLVQLRIPLVWVPCERGVRYAGRSKMGTASLIMHGIRMLMPFLDRISTRALIVFAFIFSMGIILSTVVLCLKLFTSAAIPGWATFTILLLLILSFIALGNFLIIFSIFSQSQGIGLSHIDQIEVEFEKKPSSKAS